MFTECGVPLYFVIRTFPNVVVLNLLELVVKARGQTNLSQSSDSSVSESWVLAFFMAVDFQHMCRFCSGTFFTDGKTKWRLHEIPTFSFRCDADK